MISKNISNTETVRNVFVIDDQQKIRAILVYPMNIGRNISEILRIVKALQTADSNNQMTPANWMPCEQMIVPMPQTFETLQERMRSIDQNRNGMSWYLSFKNPSICEMGTLPSDDRKEMYTNNLYTNNMEQNRNQNSIADIPEENRNESKEKQNVSQNMSQHINTNINQNVNQNISQNTKNQPRNHTIQWKNFR